MSSTSFWRQKANKKGALKMTTLKYETKYYEYLDGLRESGITNMFGASPYLQYEFKELDHKTAVAVLSNWMKTFSARQEASK